MEPQPVPEDPISKLWSRTHWLLCAFLSIPPFLLCLLSLSYVSDLERQMAVVVFSVAALSISSVIVLWKWLKMRQRTGVCPNIKHSTVCRPYFDRFRQLKFEILPGFYFSCFAGVATLLCVILTLYAVNDIRADFRMLGCSLSLSPVVLYLCWELRKKEEFRLSIAGCIILMSSSHMLLNVPTEASAFDISVPLAALSVVLIARNLAVKQSSLDFASVTCTVCSMTTAGVLGLLWAVFDPSSDSLDFSWRTLAYVSFAVWLYAGFVAMNYSIVHGSAAASTAIATVAVSMATMCFAIDVPVWCRVAGSCTFLLGSSGLVWELSSPRVLPADDKSPPPANEIEEGLYFPLPEGPSHEVV